MKRFLIACIVCLTLGVGPSFAAGLLRPADGSLPELEIEEHRVNIVINNGFAVTEVDQTFRNPHDRDLDAVYTFPLPRQASLSELSLWIDGVEVIGEVVERDRAREIVEEERQAGRETALAEKRDYLAFDVFVSPVRAGSTARVRLVYLQPIEIDSGVGRYVYPLEEGEVDEKEMSFWERRDTVDGVFSLEATIRSSCPLDDVRVKGLGEASVIQEEGGDWKIWIDDENGATRLNEDVVLYYRLAADQPARVDLLPYRSGDDPGTFMLVVTPGIDLQPTTGGVDWTIVLDVSGSMGNKIATATDAVSRALSELRPADRFRIVTFANNPQWITKGWTPAEEGSIQQVSDTVKKLGVRGGTNLYGGFRAGLTGLDADRPNAVVLVSDGGANIGPTEHGDFLKLLDETDVRVFTFVMGQGANRPLLGRLAEESGGFSMDVSNGDDLYGRLIQARSKLGREALHGVKLDLDGVGLADAAPQRMPSAYFGQQIVMFGRYTRPGHAKLRLTGRISGEERSWTVPIELPKHDERFPEIERLWALERIRDMQKSIRDGESESEYRGAIVDVGTTYSIVSDYTSMLVVREERFEEMGIERKNKKRTETERNARAARATSPVSKTRVDSAQPMFGEQPAHNTGTGTGAVGPWFIGLLAGLGGLRAWRARRKDRS